MDRWHWRFWLKTQLWWFISHVHIPSSKITTHRAWEFLFCRYWSTVLSNWHPAVMMIAYSCSREYCHCLFFQTWSIFSLGLVFWKIVLCNMNPIEIFCKTMWKGKYKGLLYNRTLCLWVSSLREQNSPSYCCFSFLSSRSRSLSTCIYRCLVPSILLYAKSVY